MFHSFSEQNIVDSNAKLKLRKDTLCVVVEFSRYPELRLFSARKTQH